MASAEMNILIIDTAKSSSIELQEFLKRFGADNVVIEPDAHKAIDRLNDNVSAFDAIFLDLHTQGMDGLELMKKIDALRYRGCIILVSTLDRRVMDYTLETLNTLNLHILGSIEKPIEKSVVAFLLRRIRNTRHEFDTDVKYLRRRQLVQLLTDDHLCVYFQPIVASKDSCIDSLECLARIRIDDMVIEPDRFIPVVERFDLFDLFMEKLFNAIARDIPKLSTCDVFNGNISINLSPLQLYDDGLPAKLLDLIERHQLDVNHIVFEITENHTLVDERQKRNIMRMRIHGLKLALDDFGAGYTNLKQLTKLPFNIIKLDAEIVNGMHSDKVLYLIVESVRAITREIDIKLIAEGVCDPHDLILLDELGIDYYQGHFYSRPRGVDDLITWMEDWQLTLDASKAFDESMLADRD